jgi:hypothetical protein
MLWTFGRFGYQDETLMDMMHDIAMKLQADCNSKALADVVYAMAQMGWADARLHTLVADYAMDNIQVGQRRAPRGGGGVTKLISATLAVVWECPAIAHCWLRQSRHSRSHCACSHLDAADCNAPAACGMSRRWPCIADATVTSLLGGCVRTARCMCPLAGL